VSQALARQKAAAKLGCRRATIPQGPSERDGGAPGDLIVRSCSHISGLVAEIGAGKRGAGMQSGRG
jgi:hypothetical protein